MKEVFVSFSRDDIVKVSSVVNELKIAGIPVWWDQQLQPAALWRKKISEKVVACEHFVVMLTPKSVSSKWVESECSLAMSEQTPEGNRQIVPVMLEDCEIPPGLAHLNVLDMKDYPDSLWGLIGLIKALSPGIAIGQPVRQSFPNLSRVEQLERMPAWQRAIEQMVFSDEFLSRSLLALSGRSNLSVLEVTQYCLSVDHILLSPYLTPAAQPIPYFGSREKLLRRYKGSEANYLDEVRRYLDYVRQRKKHREIKQCWAMIERHFDEILEQSADSSDRERVANIWSHDQLEDLALLVLGEVRQDWHDSLEKVLGEANVPSLTVSSSELKRRPESFLISALSSANIVVIACSASTELANFVLGYLHSVSFMERKTYLVHDEETSANETFPVGFVTRCSSDEIVERIRQLGSRK